MCSTLVACWRSLAVLVFLLLTPFAGEVRGFAGKPPPHTLTVRNAHAMVYDVDRREVLVYGGADASRVCEDTWRWDAATRTWAFVTSAGPGPRTFPAFAYDERNHEAILFGGNRVLFGTGKEKDSFLADTWRFRDHRWSKINERGPGARAEAAIAYDRQRARIVLFGGYRRIGEETQRLRDTWEWDGNDWMKMADTGPSPRNSAAMTYAEERRRVLLFGGPGPSNETWEWDGRQWTELKAGDVPGRFNPAIVYDATRREVVRFGGWTGKERANDTSVLRSGRWVLLNAPGPPARNHSAMVYDRNRARVVLFGGHDGDNVFGDTWEWDGTTWTMVASAPSQRFVDNGH